MGRSHGKQSTARGGLIVAWLASLVGSLLCLLVVVGGCVDRLGWLGWFGCWCAELLGWLVALGLWLLIGDPLFDGWFGGRILVASGRVDKVDHIQKPLVDEQHKRRHKTTKQIRTQPFLIRLVGVPTIREIPHPEKNTLDNL